MAAAHPARSMGLTHQTAVPRGRAPSSSAGLFGLDYKWLVLIALLPGITVVLIDVTVVNIALAKLSTTFGVDVSTVQWAITAYSLATGVGTPVASFLEARFTTKRLWLTSLTLFTSASVLCGLAPAFWVLVVGRLLQGFAGGMLLPVAQSSMFQAFPPGQRGQAMGFMAIPMVAGPALGPTVGGYIVTYWDWRLVFFINVPIGLLAVIVGLLALHPGRPRLGLSFDLLGFVFSTLGFGLTIYGLSLVGSDGWGAIDVQAFLVAGFLSLAIFAAWEITRENPLMNVRLFGRLQYLNANVVSWVSTIALFGAEFMLPLYLQNLRGLTAVEAGLLLMPQGMAAALAGPISGRLMDHVGPRWIAMLGFALLAFNTFQLSQITLTTPYSLLVILVIVRGLALGFSMQPATLSALSSVPPHLVTNASSLNTAMRNVVQSLGVTALSSIIQTQTVAHTTQLAWQVQPNTPPGQFLAQLTSLFHQGSQMSSAAANSLAAWVVLQQITAQATALAFADAYRLTFMAAGAAFFLSMLLPAQSLAHRPRPSGGLSH